MSTAGSRSRVLSLLSEACEVEHALACAYLYAGFSLRQNDLPWEAQQRARLWAAQLYFVASQEMLHLAQVWNLLTAVGGVPYYGRPVFPIDRDYFPLGAPLMLERYNEASLSRFVRWEQPVEVRTGRDGYVAPRRPGAAGSYRSVGELYVEIQRAFEAADAAALFLGNPEHQVGPELVDFPQLVKVYAPADAVRAVETIRDQGEGSPTERDDCHFGVFVDLLEALRGAGIDASYDVVDNPTTRPGPGTRITDAGSAAAIDLFDDVYVLMLRMLAWTFGPVPSSRPLAERFARAALFAMVGLLKPLGEAIARMPGGLGGNAGASFRIGRHIPLPVDGDIAGVLVSERWSELIADARAIVERHPRVAREMPSLVSQIEAVGKLV